MGSLRPHLTPGRFDDLSSVSGPPVGAISIPSSFTEATIRNNPHQEYQDGRLTRLLTLLTTSDNPLKLSEQFRTVAIRHFFLGESSERIGEALNVPPSTAWNEISIRSGMGKLGREFDCSPAELRKLFAAAASLHPSVALTVGVIERWLRYGSSPFRPLVITPSVKERDIDSIPRAFVSRISKLFHVPHLLGGKQFTSTVTILPDQTPFGRGIALYADGVLIRRLLLTTVNGVPLYKSRRGRSGIKQSVLKALLTGDGPGDFHEQDGDSIYLKVRRTEHGSRVQLFKESSEGKSRVVMVSLPPSYLHDSVEVKLPANQYGTKGLKHLDFLHPIDGHLVSQSVIDTHSPARTGLVQTRWAPQYRSTPSQSTEGRIGLASHPGTTRL